jgi:DNA helicase-2/ATP-dependent DNA helicase PcrA
MAFSESLVVEVPILISDKILGYARENAAERAVKAPKMAKYAIFDNTVLMAGILPHDLNPNQLEAARYSGGPLLITAGAGSGKTKTLTSRLLYLLSEKVPGNQIVAITFTNKAAEEMKRRANSAFIGLKAVSTDNTDLANGQDGPAPASPKSQRGESATRLASSSERDLERDGSASASLWRDGLPFIGTFHSFGARIMRKEAANFGRTGTYTIFDENDAVKIVKRILKDGGFDKVRYPFGLVRKSISKAKDELSRELDDDKLEYIYEAYEAELRRQNAFDFDDLIEKPARLLESSPDILAKYQNRFRYFLVDEYQDINTAQYRLVKLLSGKDRNLSVVGDDHQSIYSFRSADLRNFLNFERDFPDAKVVVLDQNYRSTRNIVSASSAVISNNKNQRPKTLWTENEEGDPIRVHGFESPEGEADWLAENITPGRNAAVLYRTNAQSRPIEQALVFNSIPYFVYGGLKFYDRKEIKDIVAALRYAVNPADELSKERLLKEFKKTRVRPIIDSLPEMALSLSPVEFIGYLLKETDYFTTLRGDKNFEERMENIGELISFAGSFNAVSELVERVSLLESTDQPRQNGSSENNIPVRLMTIHMAKGLEFDNVFLVGASESILPHERSIFREEDLEEERRLMYVAMTRAKKNLFISFFRNASRFLYEIPPELVAFSNKSFGDEDTIYLD